MLCRLDYQSAPPPKRFELKAEKDAWTESLRRMRLAQIRTTSRFDGRLDPLWIRSRALVKKVRYSGLSRNEPSISRRATIECFPICWQLAKWRHAMRCMGTIAPRMHVHFTT